VQKESMTDMIKRLGIGQRNPNRFAFLKGKAVRWTDTFAIQEYIWKLEKALVAKAEGEVVA
jgi:hypothetical protein